MREKFQLDPNKTAQENLYDAARIASCVVARRYNYYNLHGEYRHELIERMILSTIINFMQHKVMQHKYVRVAKNGRKLCFMDNVLSSAWGSSGNTVDAYMNELSMLNSCSTEDGYLDNIDRTSVPLYVSYAEAKSARDGSARPYDEQTPGVRARMIREAYSDYCVEAEDMNVEPMSFEAWLTATGYSSDGEAMFKLLTPDEQKEFRANPVTVKPDSELTEEQLRKRFYNREYKKRKKAKEAEEKRMEEYRRKHIAPPGYHFVIIGGVEYIRKNT